MTQAGMEKPKRGRPKKFVDLELVEKLARIFCTYSEIASTLGISVDTLERHKDFAATFKRGAEGGRKSLRRMQFESANKGNVTMQIWLGKQYLGQADQMVTDAQVNINIGHGVMETEYLRVNPVRAQAKVLPALPAAQEIEISCVEI